VRIVGPYLGPADTPHFDVPVYGTVFAERSVVVRRLREETRSSSSPTPPGVEQAERLGPMHGGPTSSATCRPI